MMEGFFSMAYKDLTGLRFGKLTVIGRAPDKIQPSGRRVIKWDCLCDCGNSTYVNWDYLNRTTIPCCSECGRKKAAKSRLIDITGQTFGDLLVIARAENKGTKAAWVCKCICGNETIVTAANLKSGNTTRCMKCRGKVIGKKKLNDLTGKQFGRWTVLHRDVDEKYLAGNAYWVCECQCGTVKSVHSRNLTSGKSLSCGCYRAENPSNAYDLTGQRFGRLKVVSISEKKRDSYRMWHCICDCGKEVDVRSCSLLNGDTVSCGCYHSERTSEALTHDLTGKKFGKLTVLERAIGEFGHAYWKCKCDCGNIVDAVDGYNLTQGFSMSCGCLNSKLETWVIQYLVENGYKSGVDFETQKNFKDDNLIGINGGLLSYDFCIWDNQNHLDKPIIKCLIECQGEQHYHAVELFGGEAQYQIQKKHDMLKEQYAQRLGVVLLEIPYTANSYEKVLDILKNNGI